MGLLETLQILCDSSASWPPHLAYTECSLPRSDVSVHLHDHLVCQQTIRSVNSAPPF